MCITVTSDRDEIEKHPTGRPLDGRDFVPSRKHSQEDFSTDSIVRKTDGKRDTSESNLPNRRMIRRYVNGSCAAGLPRP